MKMKSAPALEISREICIQVLDDERLPDTSQEGKPSTMSAHDLQNKSTRMGCSCRIDIVYGFAYPVQRSWSSNSKIGHRHVVVYGAHKPDNS
jgi:hypothetical protein